MEEISSVDVDVDVAGATGGGSGGEKKKPPEGEVKSKRKMKTASQLEILEKTYAMEAYPSEALRAELSAQLGLSDRQLQMWFCHRRLKDRKAPPGKRQCMDSPGPVSTPDGEEMAGDEANESLPMSTSGSSPFGNMIDLRRVIASPFRKAVPRIDADMLARKRYKEPQPSKAELRAIAFVEAQLGELLREDGPILGMEFDPLPPDAFGASLAPAGQQEQPRCSLDSIVYERPDVKPIKGTARVVHEYQFLPQQPTVRGDTFERVVPSYQYGSAVDVHNAKNPAFSTARPFMHVNEQLSPGYGFPGQVPSLNLMPHLLPSVTGEYENVPQKNLFMNTSMDGQLGTCSITVLDNPFISSDRRATNDEDVLRMERKRKSEEARIAREVEAHEKRIRKELERQDILRRKREEQIRKEMERQDRERRKEEERFLREKQREEERFQREQRRELERREKFLQKESIRAEKMRQKEELRREKEAARQKAAIERAIARKIAKESMELVEDARLELMELAASSKGLPSMLSLDFDTLQNLDLFKDKLIEFPPKSVLLKKPFEIQPWNNSEENVGNLLMAWRFLITFADVLGVWPFTLDEFVQALHDYDSRLLGEIHIALLRCIIKDIEDVARTPATGLGANQNNVANPGGGHPRIVEGAYAWGFDIRSWQSHLNPLTWPEILRQFALSAGFGPQLNKRNIERTCLHDENEGNDCEDVITNLRSGAAVDNAVAIMQERGFSNSRRSRHRLTPGTVKFAAFHVLSLEGSKGLTILEVADKIQKSGLRDLTTSKTPEASIGAALSRDSKLFERIAPSTYCVHPAYRKDPVDAEAILSAARERIRIFKSGFVDGEDAEDAERDEDSESDVAEDPEVDDLVTEINLKKEGDDSLEANKYNAKTPDGNGKESNEDTRTPQNGIQNVVEVLLPMHSDDTKELKSAVQEDIVGICTKVEQEDATIDESNPGEPWVQGLMEGEYTYLSVEERLNALIALIGVAIEGNSIRVILEERLEAASALKKQMWAEAQVDKRRIKEEYVVRMTCSTFIGNKIENNVTEGRQSPMVTANGKTNEISVNAAVQQQFTDPQNDMNYLKNIPSDSNLKVQDFSAAPDNLMYQQQAHVAEISRSQLKSFIGHKAEEMYVYRSLPLGQDRRRNRYWQFSTSASCNDPGCGRIFVELHDGRWRLIDSEEGFDALLASLDVRGVRESHLHTMLLKIEMPFKEIVRRNIVNANKDRQCGDSLKTETVDTVCVDSPRSSGRVADSDACEASKSFRIELGRNEAEKNHALKRYQDFEAWMWKECFSSSTFSAMKYGKKRCAQLLSVCNFCNCIYCFEVNDCACHEKHDGTVNNLKFPEDMAHYEIKLKIDPCSSSCCSASSLRMRLLKLQLALIEVSLLSEALQPYWTNSNRKSWGMRLKFSSSAEELLQLLTLLEGAIKRDYLSSNFEKTNELLGLSDQSGSAAAANYSYNEAVPVLPWVPRTTAAVALRIMELDASASYMLHQKVESQKDKGTGELIVKLPSKYSVVKNKHDKETSETQCQAGLIQEGNWVNVGIELAGVSYRRGIRSQVRTSTRSGRSQRISSSRSESGKRNSISTNTSRLGQVITWKGRPRAKGGRKCGRRSIRSRQKTVKKVIENTTGGEIPNETNYNKAPKLMVRDEWNADETSFQLEGSRNMSSSERSEYDDENDQGTGDGCGDLPVDYAGGFNGKSDGLLEGSDYNMYANEDVDDDDYDNDDVDVDEEYEQGDLDVREYANGDSNEDGIKDGDSDLNDEGTGSTSTDFSD